MDFLDRHLVSLVPAQKQITTRFRPPSPVSWSYHFNLLKSSDKMMDFDCFLPKRHSVAVLCVGWPQSLHAAIFR